MYRIFIIIGILILIFTFSGKAQDTYEEVIYTKMLRQAEKKLDSIKCSKLVDICTFETFKKRTEDDEDHMFSYVNDIMDMKINMIKADLNMCLSYRNYKKYRKCMLIFNK